MRPFPCPPAAFFAAVFCLVFALSPCGSGAESSRPTDPLPSVWDLPAALQRAMQANPNIQAARFEAEREEGVRLQVQARLLPRVSASASTDERSSSLIDRSPYEFNLPPSNRSAVARWGYDLRVEVRQLVFDGLSSWNSAQRQKLRQRQAVLNLMNVANQTVGAVRQAYDAVLVRRAQLAAERQRVTDLMQLTDWAARKQALGAIAEYELLTVQAQLEQARAELADIERDHIFAEQEFRRLLLLPGDAGPLGLTGKFEPRVFELAYSVALGLAFQHRPDLESATLAVAAGKRQERAIIGGYLPRFDVFASFAERTSYYNSARTLDGWTIGAMGSWNLFDAGESRGRRLAARAERRQAETRLTQVEHNIGSRLREQYQGLDQARAAVVAQDAARQLAARAHHQAQRLYTNGQVSLESVLQSQLTARQADNRYLDVVYRFNVLVAQIEFAIGGVAAEPPAAAPWKP